MIANHFRNLHVDPHAINLFEEKFNNMKPELGNVSEFPTLHDNSWDVLLVLHVRTG